MSSFRDTGVARGKKYAYRIRAYNQGGDSPFSNKASAKKLQEASGLLVFQIERALRRFGGTATAHIGETQR